MGFVTVDMDEGIATVTLSRPKVNALNGDVVEELKETFGRLETNPDAKAIVLTGQGNFFPLALISLRFYHFQKRRSQNI